MRPPLWYEWDPVKRVENLEKHGLAFNDAWQVFESPMCLDTGGASGATEARRLAIAFAPVVQTVCVLVYVRRGDAVRCISFRRASRREREEYRAFIEEG